GQPTFRQPVHRGVRDVVGNGSGLDQPGGRGHRGQTPRSSAKSQVSRFCFTRARKRVASSPSMIRWSHDIERFTMLRIAIASSTMTGRFTIASNERIPAFGWLMIGTLATDPYGPGFVIVNVAPWTSS